MLQPETVCIIDDDPIYVFTTKQRLQLAKFCNNIVVFNNGKEAFDALQKMIENNESLPQLILLDLNMPIWDGWDFLNEFQKIQPVCSSYIYIVSSSDNPDDIAKSKSFNIVKGFFTKPVRIEQLEAELSNV